MRPFALAAIAIVLCEPARAQDDSARLIAERDRLAASDADADRPASVPGLPLGEIDATAAVPACLAAVKAAPSDGRVIFQLGRALEAAKQDEHALAAYENAVSLGNASAANNLGNMHLHGRGGPRDVALARQYYERGAAAGHPYAMRNLGVIHEKAEYGVPDAEQARIWNERAVSGAERLAATGSRSAMGLLAHMYDKGLGVPSDGSRAAYWRLQADIGGAWEFGRLRGSDKHPPGKLCQITLTFEKSQHGQRISACHPDEAYWSLEDGKLLFKSSAGTVTTIFSKINEKRWEGEYVRAGGSFYIAR